MTSSHLASPRRLVPLRSFVIALGSVAVFSSLASAQETFSDDFERADGPVDGWTVSQGDWNIVGGVLVADGTAPEPWAWAGDPANELNGDLEASFDIVLSNDSGDGVGRHGGIMFFASEPTHRNAATITGYTLDWIDREPRGFRLIRWDGGSLSVLVDGTPGLVDPPSRWEVSVTGDQIVVTAGGDVVVDVADATYRTGHFGLWTYTNATRIEVDNLEVSFTPLVLDPCFTATPESGGAPLTVEFDSSCTTSVNAITSYAWDFGDGSSAADETASHEYQFPDVYTATLTVTDDAANSESTATVITVFDEDPTFTDGFDRDDGPVDGWTVFQGEWAITDEKLTMPAGGGESWIWAGDPPITVPESFELTLDYEFVDLPGDGVGRHGGIMFAATVPANRGDGAMNGYTIDWIDRDGGFRLIRWDAGRVRIIRGSTPELPDPPLEWRVVVQGDVIQIYGDGDLISEDTDGTYRGGFFGVWGFGNGAIAVDNVEFRPPAEVFLSACFEATPGLQLGLGETVTLDASCTQAQGLTPSTWEWEFGDGTFGQGEVVEHAYEEAGEYEVALRVGTDQGINDETRKTITVTDTVSYFEDDFSLDDGLPEGWTIFDGDWRLEDEALRIDTFGAEAWIWAGDPPLSFSRVESMEFDIEFLANPGDGVGRHGGIMFAASVPRTRWDPEMDGYTIDWIDRDGGFRLIRWDQGRFAVLLTTGGDLDPGESWRVEFDEDLILFYSDDELKIEVIDDTYRAGHFGFWAYSNNEMMAIDNLLIGEPPAPPEDRLVRGDSNADGRRNITDGVVILNFLFNAGVALPCMDSADSNDDGTVNITDGVFMLNFLFASGPDPAAPFPECGVDPTADELNCEAFGPCEGG